MCALRRGVREARDGHRFIGWGLHRRGQWAHKTPPAIPRAAASIAIRVKDIGQFLPPELGGQTADFPPRDPNIGRRHLLLNLSRVASGGPKHYLPSRSSVRSRNLLIKASAPPAATTQANSSRRMARSLMVPLR